MILALRDYRLHVILMFLFQGMGGGLLNCVTSFLRGLFDMCDTTVTGGGGVLKMAQKSVTSFMNGPLVKITCSKYFPFLAYLGHQVSLYNRFCLSSVVCRPSVNNGATVWSSLVTGSLTMLIINDNGNIYLHTKN